MPAYAHSTEIRRLTYISLTCGWLDPGYWGIFIYEDCIPFHLSTSIGQEDIKFLKIYE